MSVLTSAEGLQREQLLRGVLSELGLSQANLNALKLYNAHQPYHNWHHGVIVALNCYEAAEEANLSATEARALVLAGIYHDYDHTGDPRQADVINISRAVLGSQFWLGIEEPALTRGEKNTVAKLIAATESSHSRQPADLCEAIIMDADVLATIGPDRTQWWEALGQELGVRCDAESTLNFLRSTDCHSLWGLRRRGAAISLLEAQSR